MNDGFQGLNLWRTSLESAKKRFDALPTNSGPLVCILIQSRIPASPKPNAPTIVGLPPFISQGLGLSMEPRQSGTPGQMQPGFCRFHYGYANDVKNWREFESIAHEAGRCMNGLPGALNRLLWKDWNGEIPPNHFDSSFWIDAIFELAWQRIPGSPLVAEKFAWHGDTRIRIDQLHYLKEFPVPELPDDLTDDHWYSRIDDLVSASVNAIDALLALDDSTPNDQDLSQLSRNEQANNEIEETISMPVLLFGQGKPPIVNGSKKEPLTNAQFDVVSALIEAGDKGLTKDALDSRSGHGDARKILKRLADSDSDWKAVISFPGKTGKGYRIK